ncbi:unnamed protein product [Allacma fusca]|uniref:Major facilitator superfamily (MFS) profile domain-containing protein n=1 Tax=Allacma fusca TaxID=39272 RepID=A0A8J2JXJ7_9HEXA|nr:unnamed protein product [Allacma fusca]
MIILRAHGFPNNVSTFGLTSGFWTSSFALGSFIGPTVGGILLDNWGFRRGSLYVLCTQGVVACLVFMFLLMWWRQRGNSTKGQVLLFTDNILADYLLPEKILTETEDSYKNYGSLRKGSA